MQPSNPEPQIHSFQNLITKSLNTIETPARKSSIQNSKLDILTTNTKLPSFSTNQLKTENSDPSFKGKESRKPTFITYFSPETDSKILKKSYLNQHQNFRNDRIATEGDERFFQSFDDFSRERDYCSTYKHEKSFNTPLSTKSKNNIHISSTKQYPERIYDLLSEEKPLSHNQTKLTELGISDAHLHTQTSNSMRSPSESQAYVNAMKALQAKTKWFEERIKSLESENTELRAFFNEHLHDISARINTISDDEQTRQKESPEKLKVLEMMNTKLSKATNDLEKVNAELQEENKKLIHDKAKLKKKIRSYKSDKAHYQERSRELMAELEQAHKKIEELNKEKQIFEKKHEGDLKQVTIEREELLKINEQLKEVMESTEEYSASQKKFYYHHLQQVTLDNEALRITIQDIKQHYGAEINQFNTELTFIQDESLRRIKEHEHKLTDLYKSNMKLKELIALKNKEIESLTTKVNNYRKLECIDNPSSSAVFYSDLATHNSMMHENCQILNRSLANVLSPIEKSPTSMRNRSRKLLQTEPELSRYARKILRHDHLDDILNDSPLVTIGEAKIVQESARNSPVQYSIVVKQPTSISQKLPLSVKKASEAQGDALNHLNTSNNLSLTNEDHTNFSERQDSESTTRREGHGSEKRQDSQKDAIKIQETMTPLEDSSSFKK